MKLIALMVVAVGGAVLTAAGQTTPVARLPQETLRVMPPSSRVSGPPGSMSVTRAGCQVSAQVGNFRRRVVDVAVQEWAFFGFGVSDQTIVEPAVAASVSPAQPPPQGFGSRRGRSRISPEESARVAASIAGYWTVTPQGGWIIEHQNEAWNGPAGVGSRWQNPWSAAFISWVMCESGLATAGQFPMAIAHHRYIDEAIRARDGQAEQSIYVAYDAGETPVSPGDLLCSGRRPAYSRLAERRRQMGEGATTHCDIVVKVDEERSRILAIGGNVRSAVTMKVIPAERDDDNRLRPLDFSEIELDDNPYRGARPIFAHLKLRGNGRLDDALETSPTIRALRCGDTRRIPAQIRSLIAQPATSDDGC